MPEMRQGPSPLTFEDYTALCEDPETGQKAIFKIRAANRGHADSQARDGWFGLLAPPPKEKREALKVQVAKA
jgi:hypothetical protein